MKKLLAIALVLVLALSMVACGGGEAEEDGVITYTCITEATFPPFDTVDDEGNIIGFDMDLIGAIAEDQGFAVTFVDMEFDALIPALEAGNGDIITAGMNAEDPERREKVDFTTTYYDSALMVCVKADNETINSVDDLTADMTIASQIGTTGADKCLELEDEGAVAKAVINNGFDTCMLQLINGDIDAVIIDKPVAQAYINKQPGNIKMVGEPMNAEAYGFAVQKGNEELLNKINTGLENVIADGTYDELVAKWFN